MDPLEKFKGEAGRKRFDRELGLLVLGELVLEGDGNQPPDNPDGGEYARLPSSHLPPYLGGTALREPVAA